MGRSQILQCNQCGQDICFDDQQLSKTGKKIPLDVTEDFVNDQIPLPYHDCPNNPYKKGGGGSKVAVPPVKKQSGLSQELSMLSRISMVESALRDLDAKVGQIDNALKNLGEAIGKISFQKASGEVA